MSENKIIFDIDKCFRELDDLAKGLEGDDDIDFKAAMNNMDAAFDVLKRTICNIKKKKPRAFPEDL